MAITLARLARTTNALKGWHYGFQSRLACNHPSTATLLRTLRDEEDTGRAELDKLIRGLEPGRRRQCRALVDSGCTENLVYKSVCEAWRPQRTAVTSMSGDPFFSSGVGTVQLRTCSGQSANVSVLVLDDKPMGVEMVLGVPAISALGGVMIASPSDVKFCGKPTTPPTPPGLEDELVVDTPDFSVRFDADQRAWTMSWKWEDEAEPASLSSSVPEYAVSAEARQEFEAELQTWIDNGWLIPYDQSVYGPPRGLLPLMAVEQGSKCKVRPCLDYRQLNSHVPAHTAEADVCTDTLRRWRRHGKNLAVVDLKRAYLQIRTDQRLWPFQTVIVGGRRYALTRVGFGLNVAPLMMKKVVQAVLSQDADVERATIPYVDDLCVDEDIVTADRVVEHFSKYGLECKPPERVQDGARLLGLRVGVAGDGDLHWTRDNAVGAPPDVMTRRAVFSWCGRLVAHMPVCGWLRPAAAWLKRRVNAVTHHWDDVTDDPELREQMMYVAKRMVKDDPARGHWHVSGDSAVVWTDASSVAAGIALETQDGNIIEDGCWLRKDETTHINMAELDAALRGINLAIAWGMRVIELKTDSATVHRWLDDALSSRARLRTKAHGEMLIRRRVDIVKQLVAEFNLHLTVTLVKSADNKADCLSRVPAQWLRGPLNGESAGTCGAAVNAECTSGDEDSSSTSSDGGDGVGADGTEDEERGRRAAVCEVHTRAGHPGVRRTLFFARREISPNITRREARAVVSHCDACRSIDPAPVKWKPGKLEVNESWTRLAIDVTHHQRSLYLSVVDCGPSRFRRTELGYDTSRTDLPVLGQGQREDSHWHWW
ncbi:uncharacterized protein LOC122375611 [Amphibalanus amphitrite]|uniref:uncharacterized protein LOC122375611 n=1 Tax=Amphibalanus amphitrite TaxID=1232801 RepID=UPI001C90D619|nr:uncharacterized protein LOC122375611 [Amphibalanus amphitrite]